MIARVILFRVWLAAMACLWHAGPAFAASQTLYAASVRSGGGVAGSDVAIAGNLYTINLASGTATLVGAIRLPGGKPIGVTGLAASPKDGTLYGITSEQSPNNPHSLVTIDPATGAATLVGDLGVAGSDIGYSEKGTLYIWLPATTQLGTVNTSTAAVTPIGRVGAAGRPPGKAPDPSGKSFLTPEGTGGGPHKLAPPTGAMLTRPPLPSGPTPPP